MSLYLLLMPLATVLLIPLGPLLFLIRQRRRKARPAVTLFGASHCCAINRSKHRLNFAPRPQLPPITPEDHL